MVKEIIIKSLSLNGTRAIREFNRVPNDNLIISIFTENPLSIKIETKGKVKEEMLKDTNELIKQQYLVKMISVIQRFKARYKIDFDIEVI
jgi:hypothetical protein